MRSETPGNALVATPRRSSSEPAAAEGQKSKRPTRIRSGRVVSGIVLQVIGDGLEELAQLSVLEIE